MLANSSSAPAAQPATLGRGRRGRFIRRDDVVVIKPNVAFERAAILGTTTNPDVLRALIRVVREAHPAEIRVADNPI